MNKYKGDLGFCGDDVYIDDSVRITRPNSVSIDDHSAIDFCSYISVGAEIGKYVHIAPYVSITGGKRGFIKMGSLSSLASGCRVICCSEKFLGGGLIGTPVIPDELRDDVNCDPVIIGNMVNIGANAIIFPGVVLSEGTVIGAGSLVKRDTEPWVIYAGVPARPVKERPRYKMLEDFQKLIGG